MAEKITKESIKQYKDMLEQYVGKTILSYDSVRSFDTKPEKKYILKDFHIDDGRVEDSHPRLHKLILIDENGQEKVVDVSGYDYLEIKENKKEMTTEYYFIMKRDKNGGIAIENIICTPVAFPKDEQL